MHNQSGLPSGMRSDPGQQAEEFALRVPLECGCGAPCGPAGLCDDCWAEMTGPDSIRTMGDIFNEGY